MNSELALIYIVSAALAKSAFDDIRRLSVSEAWLVMFWAATALWQMSRGHYMALFLFPVTVWGMGWGASVLVWLFLPLAPYWPVVMVGAGAREGLLGKGDVLALSLAALVSPWAGWLGLAGMLLLGFWQRKQGWLWSPAVPGVLFGMLAYLPLALLTGGRL